MHLLKPKEGCQERNYVPICKHCFKCGPSVHFSKQLSKGRVRVGREGHNVTTGEGQSQL